MQSITFNSSNQSNSAQIFADVAHWLEVLYAEGHLQNTLSTITSLNNLEEIINYKFKNKLLLLQALTHTSFTHESVGKLNPSYERLEFLGDSILNFIVTTKLFDLHTNFSEGELSKLRGALVNEKTFSELGTLLSLSDNIFIGRGEFNQKGHFRPSLIADTFEALFGAIYLDAGVEAVEKCFSKITELYKTVHKKDFYSAVHANDFDPKTQLQEICMAQYQEHPRYVSSEHREGFSVSIWLKDKCLIERTGTSKKKLEKELAKIVLDEKKYQL